VDLNDAVTEPTNGSSLAIMQHPEGGPLKLSLNTESILGFDSHTGRLMYRTDTQPGSSGAPCFDFDWQFVALHEGRDVRGGNHNFGIPFRMIRRWLDKHDLWRHVAARSPMTTPLVRFGAMSESPAMAQFAMPANLKTLLEKGEGQLVEFKRGVLGKDGKPDMRRTAISVAAFMNSREGGNVMIGIADDGTVVGVDEEYAKVNQQRKTWDGYERSLHSSLIEHLDGASHLSSFDLTRYQMQGKDVCAIHVRPSERPVFVNDQLYVRRGNQNHPVKGRQIIDFVAARWSLLGHLAKRSEPEVELEDVPLRETKR
jgi:Putative DNA-binding domain/Trypsin-like peptidase domain